MMLGRLFLVSSGVFQSQNTNEAFEKSCIFFFFFIVKDVVFVVQIGSYVRIYFSLMVHGICLYVSFLITFFMLYVWDVVNK